MSLSWRTLLLRLDRRARLDIWFSTTCVPLVIVTLSPVDVTKGSNVNDCQVESTQYVQAFRFLFTS